MARIILNIRSYGWLFLLAVCNNVFGQTTYDASGGLFRLRNTANTITYGGLSQRGHWEGNSSVDPALFAETGHGLFFYTNGDGVNHKMKIAANGNVSIGGLNTPAYKLDITGTFRAYSQFDTYTIDGLFDPNARPSGVTTPSGQLRVRFGYLDQGGGQYWGRVGFLGNTNWSLGTERGGHSFSIGRDNGTADVLIDNAGNIGVGDPNPAVKFSVNGTIKSKKIVVMQTGWPDYVFDSSYSLMSLSNLSDFIRKNKHLPGVPSQKEVSENGLNIGDQHTILLKKIEELTLYLLEQERKIQLLINENNKLKLNYEK